MISEIAPAKINLYLHVGGVRSDGLHSLASLFVFADAGDVVTAAPADALRLDIKGPFASALRAEPPARNLVWRAAELLAREAGVRPEAALSLDKRLPIASGVGGGSADAAAALRALVRLWKVSIDEADLRALAFSLGADVPACLTRAPVIVSGAGEIIAPAPRLAPLFVCLANPRTPMPTGPVFRDFDAAHQNPPPARHPPRFAPDYQGLAALMATSRNDLQPIAIRRQPVIQTVIDRLAQRPGTFAARLSGSGASVFALFSSAAAAQNAARAMGGAGWWAMSARISGCERDNHRTPDRMV